MQMSFSKTELNILLLEARVKMIHPWMIVEISFNVEWDNILYGIWKEGTILEVLHMLHSTYCNARQLLLSLKW